MLLEALIARGRFASIPSGYEQTLVSWVLRLTADGQFVSLTCSETPKPTIVPKTKRSGIGFKAGTGFDNFKYAMGASEDPRSAAAHEAFKEVLLTIDHPAAKAAHTFLTSPTRPLILPLGSDLTDDQFATLMAAKPEAGKKNPLVSRGSLVKEQIPLWRGVITNATANHPNAATASQVIRCGATPETKFSIEVEGQPDWLTSPEAAAVHRSRLDENNNIVKKGSKGSHEGWMCSLCYQKKPLARLFPESSRFGAVLCSFQEPAWNAYGLTQGYNAPTCVECAENIALGLDNIASDKGLTHRLSKDGYLLWWPKNPSDPAPWPLLEAAINPASTEAEREEALLQITDGHFASVEKSEKRLALRRYVAVEADTLRRNVRRWNEHCTSTLKSEKAADPVWLMAMAVTPNTHKDDPKIEQNSEVIYLALVGDEVPPPRVLAPVQRVLIENFTDLKTYTNLRRAAFLAFSGEPFGIEEDDMPNVPMTDTEPLEVEARYSGGTRAMFNLGRAFARLDLLQRGKSRPQRSIQFTHMVTLLRDPEPTINTLIEKHGENKSRKSGQSNTDYHVSAYMQRAYDYGIPTRPNAAEQAAFRHGFIKQKGIQDAHYAEQRSESAKNAETTIEAK